MDSMSNSLSESTITTVRHIESFLRMYDSRVSLEPRVYEVSSINGLFSDKHDLLLQVPSQCGVDCGIHTVHNVARAS